VAKQKFDYDLIVIGSGAGGSVAAHIVAQSGKRVAIVESDTFGGETPNWGGVPAGALMHAAKVYDSAKHGQELGLRSAAIGYNFPSVKAWKDGVVRRTGAAKSRQYYESEGMTVIEGDAHFISPHEITVNRRHLSSDHFLIATGSHVTKPSIEGLDKVDYLTMREAVDMVRPPKSLFVIGAGAVGVEFAELFAIFGSKVYIADITPRILPKEDTEVSTVLQDVFTHDRGMTILTSAKVIKVAKEGVMKRVTFQYGGEVKSVKVEEILLATGKTPNTDLGLENAGVEYSAKGITANDLMQTSTRHIYAAGDVTGPYRYTHTAIYQSRIAAHNMLSRDKATADYRAVPRITFTSPEVASVGMSEEECIRKDLPIKKSVVPLTIVGRANISNVRDGFVKVMADRDGSILGATVMSPHAGEIIHELTLAIQHNLKAQDVANTLHAFPTWSEAVRSACSKI
jgi:pyruvate/2-oxoglutarate dehydrogenase complex dihydrolipoamide dehydrogenase (E3) component